MKHPSCIAPRALALLLLLLCTHELDAQPASIGTILARTDSACARLERGRFNASWFRIASPKGDTMQVAGRITFERLDTSNEYGAKARLELKPGTVTYDGKTYVQFSTKLRKTWIDTLPTAVFRLTGNVQGELIPNSFRHANWYGNRGRSADTASYLGIVMVEGHPCYRIRFADRNNDFVQGFWSYLEIDITTMLPRRAEVHYMVNGAPDFTELKIGDVEANLKLEADAFRQRSPEGYAVEYIEPEVRPVLLDSGTTAPAWTLKTAAGTTRSLADFRGKVLVLDFWYMSCAPCLKALPAMQSISERFRNKGVVVLGMNPTDKPKDDPAAFMKRRGALYETMLGADETANLYHVTAYPAVYVIDRAGRVFRTHEGYGPETEAHLIATIEAALR